DGSAPMDTSISCIIQLALLTGQRRAEICGIEKTELDLNESDPVLTVSSGRAKNRQQHRVPLSPQAHTLLCNAVSDSGNSPFVFPSPYNHNHISPRSVTQAMERVRKNLEIRDVTVHDLRRTAGSFMSKFGVPRDVRERVLNHGGLRKGDMTDGTYNQYDYDAEKRAALELWADALDCIVIGQSKKIEGFHPRLVRLNDSEDVEII
ncbi:MAG: site-specific integrase, partial [Rhizobiaceae bacterium]